MNIVKFEDLPISDEIKRSVAELGFEEPSPIQAQSIPVILTGKDVIVKLKQELVKQQHFLYQF